MSNWIFEKTSLNDVYEIQPFCAVDKRGYFLKDYSDIIFKQNGINYEIKEIFYSFSNKNVIRGLHFQRENQMPKLVRCIKGRVFDVICDLRKDSDDFGKWQSFILSDQNMKQLLIPGGFAHGFLALEDSLISYKCAEDFNSEYDDGIMWNDTTLNIGWPIDDQSEIIVSEKDSNLQSFNDFRKKYGGLF